MTVLDDEAIRDAIRAGLSPKQLQDAWRHSSMAQLAERYSLPPKALDELTMRWPVLMRGRKSGRSASVARISVDNTLALLPKLKAHFRSLRAIAAWAHCHHPDITQRWMTAGMPVYVYERLRAELPKVIE